MAMVFAAAFVAGAAAAVGVNSVMDVWRTQGKPLVESEPIFVALRSLPQGSPVTVWDVGLRNWPKAMLPASAIRAEDAFEGYVLRIPLREGQPLLGAQLMRPDGMPVSGVGGSPSDYGTGAALNAFAAQEPTVPDTDLWAPAGPAPVRRSAATQPTSADVPPLVPAVGESTPTTEPQVRAAADDGQPETTPVAVPTQAAPGPTVPQPSPPEQVAGTPNQPPGGLIEQAGETSATVTAVDASAPVVAQPLPASMPANSAGLSSGIPPDTVSAVAPDTVPEPVSRFTPESVPATVQRGPNEPTPADTGDVVPPPQDEPPLVSVMKPTADPAPAAAGTATVTSADTVPPRGNEPRHKQADGMVRYLVVPERIAREADSLFATASPHGTQAAEPPTATQGNVEPMPTAAAAQGKTLPAAPQTLVDKRDEEPPAVVLEPAPASLQPAPRAPGRPTPSMRPSMPTVKQQQPARQPVAKRPMPAPRQSQAPSRQPAPSARRGSADTGRQWREPPQAEPEKSSRFGAVMSSITSGFGTMVGGRKGASRAGDYDEAVATDEPQLLPAPLPR
jgi:hypothetical protein